MQIPQSPFVKGVIFMDKQTQKKLLELVRRNYEEIAADFDLTRKKYLWPELLKLTEQAKDGDRVLDVGCGNGRLVRAFGEKKISYWGVDSSEKLVEAARKNLDSRLPSEILGTGRGNDKEEYKFQVADILELDKLPEKDFNYVFCVAVLHHLPGDEPRIKALKQMKNKLADGGKIIITVWNLWSRLKFRKLILKYGLLKLIGKSKLDRGDILFDWKNNQGEPLSRRYYHAFSQAELGKTAEKAGLKLEKLYHDKYNYYLFMTK